MSSTERHHKPASSRRTVGNTADLKEWKFVVNFGSYYIYVKDDIRRIIDTDTHRVIARYEFKKAGEGDIDAKL